MEKQLIGLKFLDQFQPKQTGNWLNQWNFFNVSTNVIKATVFETAAPNKSRP